MEVGHRQGVEQNAHLVEMPRGLAGEADDDVGANRCVGETGADIVDQRTIVRGRVGPLHRREHRIRAMLQRKMKVRCDARRTGRSVDNLRRTVHGLERADTKLHVIRPLAQHPDEMRERGAVAQIAPVRSEMHASNRNFAVPGSDGESNVTNHVEERPGTAGAACAGDDAVAARLIASSLNAEYQRRPPGDPRLQRQPARTLSPVEPLRRRPLACGVERGDERVLRVVAHDPHDVGKRADFLGPARRVAAGYNHFHARVVAGNPPDRLSRALIGTRCDRTGVDDNKVGVIGRRIDGATATKLLFDDEGVRLVHTAAERDDGVLHTARAFRPMSVRSCMPSNPMCDAAAYAVSIASRYVAPRPTTVSTRPPAVTVRPSCRAVPA